MKTVRSEDFVTFGFSFLYKGYSISFLIYCFNIFNKSVKNNCYELEPDWPAACC